MIDFQELTGHVCCELLSMHGGNDLLGVWGLDLGVSSLLSYHYLRPPFLQKSFRTQPINIDTRLVQIEKLQLCAFSSMTAHSPLLNHLKLPGDLSSVSTLSLYNVSRGICRTSSACHNAIDYKSSRKNSQYNIVRVIIKNHLIQLSLFFSPRSSVLACRTFAMSLDDQPTMVRPNSSQLTFIHIAHC